MNKFIYALLEPQTSAAIIDYTLFFMRVGIGLLTIGHGIPKITGGVQTWAQLGTFVNYIGIYFWPIMWGFLGACTEFFGGIMLTFGLGTRLASAALTFMMIVAFAWHYGRGDSFNHWSFPVSLIFVYLAYFIIGGGKYSLDYYLMRG